MIMDNLKDLCLIWSFVQWHSEFASCQQCFLLFFAGLKSDFCEMCSMYSLYNMYTYVYLVYCQ